MREVWFWQRIVSPHMAGLAAALARQGVKAVYVAEQVMSEDRALQGWRAPDLPGVRIEVASTRAEISELAGAARADSIHICQGIRANGLVGVAQRRLSARSLRQWATLETLDDTGLRGVVKRLEYRRLFVKWRSRLAGVLAIGYRTPRWIAERGVPTERVMPFAYFLLPESVRIRQVQRAAGPYRFVFVGQLVEGKRLDLLLSALADLKRDVELVVIGSGPLEDGLRVVADRVLPGRVDWVGRLPMHEVPQAVADSDCLVLPSRHDGWGAVVSEALMVGTPVVCSDHCGSAGVAKESGHGEVFRSGNVAELRDALGRAVQRGRMGMRQRTSLANWAKCLGTDAGAKYLQEILDHADGRGDKPRAPWDHRASVA